MRIKCVKHLNTMGDMTLNFSRWEFACKGKDCCDHSAPIDYRIPKLLEKIRTQVSVYLNKVTPLSLTSAFRCIKYNCTPKSKGGVGSSAGSQHPLGTAVDLTCPVGMSIDTFAEIVKQAMIDAGIKGGVGRYPTFVHMDVRGEWAFWDER